MQKNFSLSNDFFLTSVTLVKRKLHAHAEKYLKKYLKNACAIQGLCYSLGMENAFATISAESDLRDMIALTPEETTEANAWFDQRETEMEDSWLDGAYEARTEMDF